MKKSLLLSLALATFFMGGCGSGAQTASLSPLPAPIPVSGPRTNPTVPTDGIALRFGFVGCNRIPTKNAMEQNGGSDLLTANSAHLTQTVQDLKSLRAQFLFFAGDVVMAEVQDSTTLASQLEAWSLFWSTISGGFPLYVTPGNHEMVYADSVGEFPNLESGPQYRTWLATHPEYNPGITPGPTSTSTYPGVEADGLVDDQSQMSYYYDVPAPALRDPRFADARFIRLVALNTDTLTSLPETPSPYFGTGRAPWNWFASVLAQAQADPKIGGVIVMGHRPFAPVGDEELEMDPLTAQKLYAIMRPNVYSADNPQGKLRFYMSAHAHMHDVGQLSGPPEAIVKTNSPSGEVLGVYEIVAGCCGSPLETTWAANPTWGPGLPSLGIPFTDSKGKTSLQPYFGFQFVVVAIDGSIEVFNFGRLINPPYDPKTYFKGPTQEAQPLSSVVVYP